MRIGSLTYLFKQGVKNAYVNKAMSLASVGVLTACLIIVGVAALFSVNIKNIMGAVQQQNEIVAYVDDEIEAGKEAQIDRQIRALPNVVSVEYISKEQAFKEQKDKLGELLEGYENEGVFPASYRIKVKDAEILKQDVELIKGISGIYKVDAPTDIAEVMMKIDSGVTVGGIVLIIALLAVSFVIIMNTIKITVFSRRREINIMKYVGATNGFIRLPFIVEGIIIGAISAVVAFLIIWALYSRVYSGLSADMSVFMRTAADALISFKSIGFPLFLVYLFMGALVGSLGSAISIRKHLKV